MDVGLGDSRGPELVGEQLAIRAISPRWWTVGISIACLNTSRVFACHALGNWLGTVRGSVAATARGGREGKQKPEHDTHDYFSPGLRDATRPAPLVKRRAVPFGQIFGASHLFEPADGALELEAAVAWG